jgi:hypothetical protein
MKKKFFLFAATAIAVTLTHNTYAQTTVNDSGYYVNPCDETIFIHHNQTKPDAGIENSNDVDIRALKNFHKEFPQVNNESWYKMPRGGYIANFNDHSVQTIAAFNPNGTFHHSIDYYDEKNLPRDVWNQVKSNYFAYNISKVAAINFEHQTVYMVYIEDGTYHKVIRVSQNEFEEVESFRNG